ncbi:manganese transport regulator MntR [Halolamina pelagica]|uniref:Manganese transport regulator MntR n=1 Tax=Halolamina pelagica TaxID=699431 RepID=A0A0N8HZY6_9EURY|nr:manganese transport regulator MntR [Halolamina pelagica]
MMEKLDERGLIDREKYRGVELTEEGQTVALEVVRHHRLLEAYLAEHLDFDWTEVHDEADTLEHHISEDLERRMAEALDDPAVDPHGDPIPTETLEPVDEAAGERLSSFAVGDRVVVSRVHHREQDELDYLAAAGLTPNTTIEIVDVAPFGMVTVRLADGDEQSLPEDIADAIRVRSATEEVA